MAANYSYILEVSRYMLVHVVYKLEVQALYLNMDSSQVNMLVSALPGNARL
jgi:hypothetical protein